MSQHHLSGLYLDNLITELMRMIDASETPLDEAIQFIDNLPKHYQRDLLCGFLREMRTLMRKTACEQIASKATQTDAPS